MRRTQLVLGGLLLVQAVLILLLRSPMSRAVGGAEARPLLPALTGISPIRLELQGPDQEKVTLLSKGGRWTVEEAGGFPADAQKVSKLLDDLRGLKVRNPVVSSSRYHSTFKVKEDQPEARIRIWDDAAGEPKADLMLGTSPNYRTTHVRRAGEDPIYEVRGLATYDIRADRGTWIEKKLVDVPEAALVGLSLTNAKGSFELEKQDGAWVVRSPENLKGRKLDQEKVAALIRSATPLRLADAAGALDEQAQGLASPAATLKLRWTPAPAAAEAGEPAAPAAPQELVLRVGGKVEGKDDQRYVTASGFDYAGTIWDSSVEKLLSEQVADLAGTS